eukprot:4817543-Prymnesium_polylepis.1
MCIRDSPAGAPLEAPPPEGVAPLDERVAAGAYALQGGVGANSVALPGEWAFLGSRGGAPAHAIGSVSFAGTCAGSSSGPSACRMRGLEGSSRRRRCCSPGPRSRSPS